MTRRTHIPCTTPNKWQLELKLRADDCCDRDRDDCREEDGCDTDNRRGCAVACALGALTGRVEALEENGVPGGDPAALDQILADIAALQARVIKLEEAGAANASALAALKDRQDDADRANNPENWPVGVEQEFLDGTYGKRLTGNFTAAANAIAFVELFPENYSIVEAGGEIYYDSGRPEAKHNVGFTGTKHIIPLGANTNVAGKWTLSSTSGYARTNAPYDVWVRYRKPAE